MALYPNEILQFAVDGTVANQDVLDINSYRSDTERLIGNRQGVARRELVNTAMYQSSLICAGVAEAMANFYAGGITNQMTMDQVSQAFTQAVSNIAANGVDASVAALPNKLVKSDNASNIHYNTEGSAAKLTTARTIGLSGGVTGTATAFDGTANVTIPVTAINANNITSGTITGSRVELVTHTNNGAMLSTDKVKLDGATSTNTVSTIVLRDASGNFAGNVITASILKGSGSDITALNANNISSGVVPVARLPLVSTTTDGIMSAADKQKLDGISGGEGDSFLPIPTAVTQIMNISYTESTPTLYNLVVPSNGFYNFRLTGFVSGVAAYVSGGTTVFIRQSAVANAPQYRVIRIVSYMVASNQYIMDDRCATLALRKGTHIIGLSVGYGMSGNLSIFRID